MDVKANKVINGTFGTIWVNNERWAEVEKFNVNVNFEYEDVNMAGDLATHKKMIGWNGEGGLTIKKVFSRTARLIGEQAKTGIVPDVKIVGKLADPDAHGAERISVEGITFDGFSLMDYEVKVPGKEELSFAYSDYDFIDLI